MNTQTDTQALPRRLGRSVLALLAGFAVGIILSLGTDLGLHAVGVAPALSERWPSQLLLLATVYRAVYSVIASYVVARLAPYRPMGHALVGGAVGFGLSVLGAAATWNRNLGPHWYSIALLVIALPSAWIGGALRLRQLQAETTAA